MMKKILCLILFSFPFTSVFAQQCPLGHHGERFLSVKMLPDKVICYYDHNQETIIEGSFKPMKPYYWYFDVVNGGYMCLGVRNCQFTAV